MIRVAVEPSFEGFRQRCRELLAANIAPHEVIWEGADCAQLSLLAPNIEAKVQGSRLTVPRRYFDLARMVSAHRSGRQWGLLYSVLWRIAHGERNLLAVQVDDEVLQLVRMRKEISGDIHHMHAFVRFRRIEPEGEEWFVAWYRPDHRILRLAAHFFADRFAAMRWAILTPDESVSWDGENLQYSAGVDCSAAPKADELESLWSAYYSTTFNPARMNLDLMRQELPARFWPHLPEMQGLAVITAEAPARVEKMRQQQAKSNVRMVPEVRKISVLRDAALTCTSCPLYCDATQTVFGEGPDKARLVLVGEQPGDIEDLRGHPFVGPAGEVLDRALAEAGLERTDIYFTNAVKHFKFVRQGKRRIHQTPRMSEIIACRPWLEAELETIGPRAIVLLGATAAKSLLGGSVRVTHDAGRVVRSRFAEHTVISVHPSFVLRSGDKAQSQEIFQQLVRDLAAAGRYVSQQEAG